MRRGVSKNCELSRRAARLRCGNATKCNRSGRQRRDGTDHHDGGDRRIALFGRIDQAIERGAVAAGRAVGAEGLNRVVMPVDDMGDGIQRERQQQADECDSQPGRGSPRQMENGHIADLGTEGLGTPQRSKLTEDPGFAKHPSTFLGALRAKFRAGVAIAWLNWRRSTALGHNRAGSNSRAAPLSSNFGASVFDCSFRLRRNLPRVPERRGL